MNYHNITKDDMNNGDGIRVVLWVAGCDHHCPECQNPQTWDKKGGISFDEKAISELYTELSKDYVSGITLSGGDPLFYDNVSHICALLNQIKEDFPDKTVWLYTGYNWGYLLNSTVPNYMPVLKNVDVLIDGEYVKDLRDINLKWRGSMNQRVIDVQKSLSENKLVLWCD